MNLHFFLLQPLSSTPTFTTSQTTTNYCDGRQRKKRTGDMYHASAPQSHGDIQFQFLLLPEHFPAIGSEKLGLVYTLAENFPALHRQGINILDFPVTRASRASLICIRKDLRDRAMDSFAEVIPLPKGEINKIGHRHGATPWRWSFQGPRTSVTTPNFREFRLQKKMPVRIVCNNSSNRILT